MILSLKKLKKAVRLLADSRFRPGLLKGVAATIEHCPAFEARRFRTVVDIGANRGQFALLMAGLYPDASIIAFEPLQGPFAKLQEVTAGQARLRAINAAIGPARASRPIYVSKRDDSSSLLPITAMQETIFPNTGLARTDQVEVGRLEDFLKPADIAGPSLLKIDVQGFELEALAGCGAFLDLFDAAYVEASFVQLYEGQGFADEVIDRLHGHGLRLVGIYNLGYTSGGQTVQADFLFERRKPSAGQRTRPALAS